MIVNILIMLIKIKMSSSEKNNLKNTNILSFITIGEGGRVSGQIVGNDRNVSSRNASK